MSGSIGPSLPPGFAIQGHEDGSERGGERAETSSALSSRGIAEFGSQAPHPQPEEPEVPHIGPQLPPHLNPNTESAPIIGPQFPLPPSDCTGGSNTTTESSTFGPVLPPEFKTCTQSPNRKNTGITRLPCDNTTSSNSEGSDEEVIGPMPNTGTGPVDDREELRRTKLEIEARSQAMKDKLTGKGSEEAAELKREEWMLELPAEFKPLGVGARKFRTTIPNTGDRSVWTDTPADRLKRAEEALRGKEESNEGKEKKKKKKTAEEEMMCAYEAEREKALAEQVEKYNREHRSQSLMELHRKRKAEEVKEKGGVVERRPFNRETDLEAPRNLVTPAKRKALMKDSQHALSSKFQRGSKSFL